MESLCLTNHSVVDCVIKLMPFGVPLLTAWGRVAHICVSILGYHWFRFQIMASRHPRKCHWKYRLQIWRQFCFGLNVLRSNALHNDEIAYESFQLHWPFIQRDEEIWIASSLIKHTCNLFLFIFYHFSPLRWRTSWSWPEYPGNLSSPVYSDHLMGYLSAFWSSSRWPRVT